MLISAQIDAADRSSTCLPRSRDGRFGAIAGVAQSIVQDRRNPIRARSSCSVKGPCRFLARLRTQLDVLVCGQQPPRRLDKSARACDTREEG